MASLPQPARLYSPPTIVWLCFTVHMAGAADFVPGERPPPSSVPLIQALIDDDLDAAHALLDGGADVNAYDVITPLYAAQEYVRRTRERHRMIRRLLKLGAEVDRPTKDDSTVLMLAAQARRRQQRCPCCECRSAELLNAKAPSCRRAISVLSRCCSIGGLTHSSRMSRGIAHSPLHGSAATMTSWIRFTST